MWWCLSVRVKSIFPRYPPFPCSGYLVRSQAGKGHETAIVHNAFKLPHRFEELCNRFPVPYLFGDKETPAKGGEVTLHPAAFLCGFRQEQIAGMVQERSFIEMPFKGTGKETQIILLDVRRIVLFDEPVLFVYDAVIGQHLYRLVPSGMYRFVFGCRDGKQFGLFHPERHRYVGIFGNDAAVFHREQWKLVFQRGSF